MQLCSWRPDCLSVPHVVWMQDFVPDRFLEGEGQGRHHPYAYAPFGAGPRKCIGYRSASPVLLLLPDLFDDPPCARVVHPV